MIPLRTMHEFWNLFFFVPVKLYNLISSGFEGSSRRGHAAHIVGTLSKTKHKLREIYLSTCHRGNWYFFHNYSYK
jgi:hypothetical protein